MDAGKPPNAFFGSFDAVLDAMDRHVPVDLVIAPRGKLRNMRLERRLRERGVDWREVDGREAFYALADTLPGLGHCAVAGFAWRMPQPLIDRCRTLINFHPGDLFRCRGPQPIAAALYFGHDSLGACAHRIDSERMDAGPLLGRELMAVEPERDYNWHQRRLHFRLTGLAARLFERLAAGDPLPGEPWEVREDAWYERLPRAELERLWRAPSVAAYRAGRSAGPDPAGGTRA